MKKIRLVCVVLSFILLQGIHIHGASVPEGEGGMHYGMALSAYKSGNMQECLRVLYEALYYYDTENIPCYKLLAKVYDKMGDKQKADETRRIYKRIIKIKEDRAKGKLEKLTPLQALDVGLPVQKIEACNTIAKSGDLAAIPNLIKALSDPYFNFYYGSYEVREAASKALISFGEKAIPSIIKATDSGDPDLRCGAFETLSKIEINEANQQQQVESLFIKALKDPSKNVKLIAIKRMGVTKNDRAIDDIIALSSDPAPEVRYFSAMAIGDIYKSQNVKSEKAVDVLMTLLEDKDKLVMNQAIKSIVYIGGEKVENPLLNIAKDEKKETITRWYAIRGLGLVLSEKSTAELTKLMDNDNFWLRSAAAFALGKPEHSKVLTPVVSKKEKDIIDESFLKFSLSSPIIYEEARLNGIEKALKYLESIQKKDGSFASYYPLGTTELVVLMFLKQNYKEDYPVVKKGLEYILKYQKKDGSFYSDENLTTIELGSKKIAFTTGLAIKLFAKTGNSQYRSTVSDALNWLKNIQNSDGGFGYYKGSRSDITSTTFCIEALSIGYEYYGMKKNDETWIKALDYLKNVQNKDGGFGYNKQEQPESYGSATASGMLSLLRTGADTKLTDKSFAWISENYSWEQNPFDKNPNHYQYYVQELANALNMYGKETIKDKEGKIHFWYQDVLRKLLTEQSQDGSWASNKEPLFTTYFISVLQLKQLPKSLGNM